MKKRRALAAVLLLIGVLVIAALGFGWWLKCLFNEPAAREVASLSDDLQAHQILAVFAHPDDEILAAGFLADAARRGLIVNSVTATKGEAGKMDPPICRREDLGLIREAELRKYGYVLGMSAQEVWDFPDSKLSEVANEELVRRLVSKIRNLHPDVIITFEPATGFTMNSDHATIGRAATDAFHESGNTNFAPDLGAQFGPSSLVYILAPRKAMQVLGGQRGKNVAKLQPTPEFAMRCDPQLKIAGWQVHESQAGYLKRQWGFPACVLYRLMNKEYFAVSH